MKYITLILICSVNLFAKTDGKKRSEFGLLTFSKIEVENVQNIINGDIILDKIINKADLLNKLSEYDIIHIATHTQIDNKNSLLTRFLISDKPGSTDESNSIFISDIYPLRLNAKMAVLSSCNTGTGELLEGEGIISLARAFKFAGCPAIIMSLWEIDDISSAEIMKNFYSELKNGKQKDEALREAKLAYLKNSNSKSAAPVFWAGTVPIGNLEKLNFEKHFSASNYLFYFSIAFLISISIYFLARKRAA